MEINVRSQLGFGLAVDLGIDIPYIAYRDISGEPVEPVDSYKLGVKWLNLGLDVMAFLHYHRTKQLGFWSWVRSVAEARSYAYFAWDDPGPFIFRLLELMRYARRYLRV